MLCSEKKNSNQFRSRRGNKLRHASSRRRVKFGAKNRSELLISRRSRRVGAVNSSRTCSVFCSPCCYVWGFCAICPARYPKSDCSVFKASQRFRISRSSTRLNYQTKSVCVVWHFIKMPCRSGTRNLTRKLKLPASRSRDSIVLLLKPANIRRSDMFIKNMRLTRFWYWGKC